MKVRKFSQSVLTFLCLCLSISALASQSGTNLNDPTQVSGVVLDQAGQPLIGVFVLEKGTSNGTMTDVDGQFSLSVPSDAVLEISCMGYVTQDIAVGGKSYFNVVLATDNQLLEEVVVVGYGSTKKINLTGAVSVIKADDLQDRAALSASRMLQGSVPGLNITSG